MKMKISSTSGQMLTKTIYLVVHMYICKFLCNLIMFVHYSLAYIEKGYVI